MTAKKKPADLLSNLQIDLITEVHRRITEGTADAATLNVARQILKDSNIQPSHEGKDRGLLHKLSLSVPFPASDTNAA